MTNRRNFIVNVAGGLVAGFVYFIDLFAVPQQTAKAAVNHDHDDEESSTSYSSSCSCTGCECPEWGVRCRLMYYPGTYTLRDHLKGGVR